MPWIIAFLAALVGNLFKGVAKFLLGMFGGTLIASIIGAILKLFRRIGGTLLYIAAVALAIGVFSSAISIAFGRIASLAPSEFVEIGAMFVPDNVATCLSIIIFARISSLVFFWVERIQHKLSGS